MGAVLRVLIPLGSSRPSPAPGGGSQRRTFSAASLRAACAATDARGSASGLRGLSAAALTLSLPRAGAPPGRLRAASKCQPPGRRPCGEASGSRRASLRGPRSATPARGRTGAGRPGSRSPGAECARAGGVTGSPRCPRRRALGLSPPREPEPRGRTRPPLALSVRLRPPPRRWVPRPPPARGARARVGPGGLRSCADARGRPEPAVSAARARAWVSTRPPGGRGGPGAAPGEGLGDRARLQPLRVPTPDLRPALGTPGSRGRGRRGHPPVRGPSFSCFFWRSSFAPLWAR